MPLAEGHLFQLVQQQLTRHFGRTIPLHKAGRYLAAASLAQAASVLVKTKYSTEHLPDNLRQVLDHVGWYTFSKADIASSAPPFLTLTQGAGERDLRHLVLTRQKLRQLIASNGQDFHLHVDFAKVGHVFASRGLSTAEREACAHSRDYLTRHYPERDLAGCLDGWQQLAS